MISKGVIKILLFELIFITHHGVSSSKELNFQEQPAESLVHLEPLIPNGNDNGIKIKSEQKREASGSEPTASDESSAENGYENLGKYSRQFSTSADSAFIQKRLFNTSVALTVPLFSFTLPQRASPGSTVDLANQAIFGLFALLVTVFVFAVPVLFTGTRPSPLTGRSNGDSSSGILNNLMRSNTNMFNLMGADLTNKIGLDPNLCFKKTICEAHKHPKKFGLIALPFRIFFPPPVNGTDEGRSSVFQLAAKDGITRKNCGRIYNCFFDILDLTQYAIDWYHWSSGDPDFVME